MKNVKIGNYLIGNKNPPLIVAEAGINHNGSYKIAKKLIDEAKKSGADCIKFQTHIPEKEMIKTSVKVGHGTNQTIWELFKECQLSEKEEKNLSNYCKKKDILFMSTPFSIDAVDRLDHIGVKAFKIGSGELTNIPFLEHIAKKRKPVILSTGMSSINEIKRSVKLFKKYRTPLIIMQATSTYPTKYEDVNLGVIQKFSNLFKIPIGLSDHSTGIYTAIAAVALGASVIEKHFTLDKNMPGPDQKLSLNPYDFTELVKGCKAVKLAMGNKKRIIDEEKPIIKFARESVVSIMPINKGEKFSIKNISTKRPGTGKIPASKFFNIVGRKASKNLPTHKQISYSDVI